MSKHTPGPWTIYRGGPSNSREVLLIPDDGAGDLITVKGSDREANACLISAAPELLEALHRALPAVLELEANDSSWSAELKVMCALLVRVGVAK